MSETLSFASEVKEEISHLDRSDENKRALLSSFIKINGHLRLSKGQEILELSSERPQIAKLMYQYIHELYGVNVRFAYTRSVGFLKRMIYHVLVEQEAEDILSDLEIDLISNKLPKNFQGTFEQSASYLAGAFLAAGSLNDPRSRTYHLEISLSNEEYANWFLKSWSKVASHQFSPKLVVRRNRYIVYIKKSEEISDFLILIGAKESCLKFENVRVDRDFRNVTNRLSNLDTANMSKTLNAAERQKKEIEYFKKNGGLESFHNPKLLTLCELRLAHEDASLGELADLLSNELASSTSKSNVNHLFRFLDEEYRKANHERK
jgi:DNA-binding protein WhiA